MSARGGSPLPRQEIERRKQLVTILEENPCEAYTRLGGSQGIKSLLQVNCAAGRVSSQLCVKAKRPQSTLDLQ